MTSKYQQIPTNNQYIFQMGRQIYTNIYPLSRKPLQNHRCSVRKGVLRNFAKFTGKHLRRSLFLNKVSGLRPVTL